MTDNKPWRDEDILRALYWGQELSLAKIAEKLGCSRPNIRYWMDKHGIERRRAGQRVEWATYRIDGKGYARWESRNPDTRSLDYVKVQQLLACLDHDPHEVFAPDTVTHHRSAHPLDNRPGNIEVMGHGEHTGLHNSTPVPECKHRLLQTATIMSEERA